ncbi:alkaline phosphatase family protein [Metabacillus idriensis]|uniref:alkaline phosphatase family protein n=1 Tax=Metabacillus idriensis TaxID=324768 RepID=UPI00174A7B89|nr:alkaline phosphatase family protein [Metabacillus idriensis]
MTNSKPMAQRFNKFMLAGTILFTAVLSPGMNAEASPKQSKKKETAVVISFDGMRADFTQKYIKEGVLPNIERVTKKGVTAENSTTIFPSLTAPSHISIGTGANPSKTGVVSNWYHLPGTKLTDGIAGFNAPIEVNPIWREAREQGKTTATVGFAGANPEVGEQADYTVGYGKTWTGSSYDSLNFVPAADWINTPKSYSKPKEAIINLKLNGQDRPIQMLAIDSKNDKKMNYNTFYLSEDKVIDKNDSVVSRNEWGSLPLNITEGVFGGFWFKLKEVNDDLSSVKMYRTAVTSNLIDGPEGFEEEIAAKFGFFPMQDDTQAFKNGWISREEYEEVSARFVNWLNDVALYIKKEYTPDLLMFYAPHIDHEEHEFLLTDSRQPGYTPEKSAEYMEYIKWSYKLADQVVGKTLKNMKDKDNLFLVADHGMDAIHSMLEANKELKDAGLLVLDQNGKVDLTKTKAYAFTSGSVAHVYVNLKDREQGGIVKKEEYNVVVNQIVDTFSKSLDKEGKKTYEQIMTRDSQQAKAMGISHPNSGDVILGAASGYAIDGNPNAPASIQPTWVLGMHGGNPDLPQMKPNFMAVGHSISKGKTIGPVKNIDIAPTIYEILGLNIPSFVEGQVIDELIKK